MAMRWKTIRARALAGVGAIFLLAQAARLSGATRVQIAAERGDGSCPAASPVFGVVRLTTTEGPAAGADLSRCVVWVFTRDTSDAALDRLSSRLAALSGVGPVLLDLASAQGEADRIPFAIKKLSSAARSVSPGASIGLFLADRPAGDEDLSPYVDALVPRPPRVAGGAEESIPGRWIFAGHLARPDTAVVEALAAVSAETRPSVGLVLLDAAAATG